MDQVDMKWAFYLRLAEAEFEKDIIISE